MLLSIYINGIFLITPYCVNSLFFFVKEINIYGFWTTLDHLKIKQRHGGAFFGE